MGTRPRLITEVPTVERTVKKAKGPMACKFHLKGPGACRNGSDCPFSHDPGICTAALEDGDPGGPTSDIASSVPCKFFMNGGACRNGDSCPFSHDPEIIAAAFGLGGTSSNSNAPGFKTQLCKFWDIGQCTRGISCTFAHGIQELTAAKI